MCVAVCCSVLQCAAVCYSVLQCVAVRYSALQCVAVCRSVLQCVAGCCRELQGVVVCCIVLQCVAAQRRLSPCNQKYTMRSEILILDRIVSRFLKGHEKVSSTVLKTLLFV